MRHGGGGARHGGGSLVGGVRKIFLTYFTFFDVLKVFGRFRPFLAVLGCFSAVFRAAVSAKRLDRGVREGGSPANKILIMVEREFSQKMGKYLYRKVLRRSISRDTAKGRTT